MGKDVKRDYDSFREAAKRDFANFSNSAKAESDDFFADVNKEFDDFGKKANKEMEEIKTNAANNVKKFNEGVDEEYEAFKRKREAARAAQKQSTENSNWVEVQAERPIEYKTDHGPEYADDNKKIESIEKNAAKNVQKFNDSVDAKAAGNERVTEKGVQYKVTEKGVEMSGNAAALGNIDRLMPKMYEIQDSKTYACGPVRGTINSAAKMAAQARVQNVMLGQEVYNDMKKRAANGESLKDAEKNFMTKHEKDLKDFTLEMTADGKLKQLNPKSAMQITPTPVKDAASLPKQVEKDIKATAQMQQQMAMRKQGMSK